MAGVTETTLLATDQQHSVLKTTGTNPQQMAYTAYGHHPVESGLSSLLGFNGERPDSITGHYLLGQGNRAFNPVLMRFNSPDELSPFGEGGINPYAYCGNDPINRYDPTGNIPVANFRPWNFTKLFRPWKKQPLNLSSTTISRSRLVTRNPRLDAQLGQRGTTTRRPDSSTLVSQAEPFTGHLPKTTTTGQKHESPKSYEAIRLRKLIERGDTFDRLTASTPDYKVWSNPDLTSRLNRYTDRLSELQKTNAEKRPLDKAKYQIRYTQYRIKEFSLEINGDLIRSQQNR
ncbi:RHS repeat-associated core domain-containing protein [Pseudomonas fluorescens]|uniref:RHS repeat-associated core domain-containing protein n=1 Tax=Pseudomonas fluorescens TaxID=294 RepID=A0A5E7AZN0_PSEFL|nr:hypothetical protein PS723_01164 [Pseudomonas fluorescens]